MKELCQYTLFPATRPTFFSSQSVPSKNSTVLKVNLSFNKPKLRQSIIVMGLASTVGRDDMIVSKFTPILLIFLVSMGWSKKQKIVIRLREPLRAESIKIRIPELTSVRGGTRDLETKLELGPEIKAVTPKDQVQTLKLNLDLKTLGTNGVQVTLSLPDPGFVEVAVMDFYGKNLATLVAQEKVRGVHILPPYFPKDLDHNGIKFVTLKINGKMVLQKTISKVR